MNTEINTAELRKLAESATAGPWDYDTHDTPIRIAGGEVVGGDCTGIGDLYTAYDATVDENLNPEPLVLAQEVTLANGRYMRAANPSTMLALLDSLEEQSAEIEILNRTCQMLDKLRGEEKARADSASQQGSEPVAWMRKSVPHPKLKDVTLNRVLESDVPLYTHPIAPAEKAVRLHDSDARYQWLAGTLLAPDYGDNDLPGQQIGWRIDNRYAGVYGHRNPVFIAGPTIDAAIDAAIAAAQEGSKNG
jgi:hypothetical protein